MQPPGASRAKENNLRSLPPSNADIYNRKTLSSRERGLQDGTPKWLEAGQARACYAAISATGGLAFYDRYFQPVRASSGLGLSTFVNTGNLLNITSAADVMTLGSLFKAAATNVTQITNQATADYSHACHSSGEFGNAITEAFSNGTAVPPHNRLNEGRLGKSRMNMCIVNSDHDDQAIVYIQYGQALRAVMRIDGDINYDAPGTTSFTLDHTGYGQCSYNAKRKEFIQVTYFNSGQKGGKRIVTYTNVDLNRYPSPAEALSRPGVTKKTQNLTTIAGWLTTDTQESQYNTKVILCDDGTVYLLAHFTSGGLYLYRLNRNSSLDVTTVDTIGYRGVGGTTYGMVTDIRYGVRLQQSRDKKACIVYMPYAYYGAGVVSYVIDKERGTASALNFAQKENTTSGANIVPCGDDGFACYVTADVTASVGANALVTYCYKSPSGWNDVNPGITLPHYPLPKTIYYPALTQVVDYSMLNNQTLS